MTADAAGSIVYSAREILKYIAKKTGTLFFPHIMQVCHIFSYKQIKVATSVQFTRFMINEEKNCRININYW